MAAASYKHHYHDHLRPLTILYRDDGCFMGAKLQTLARRKSAVELLQETKSLYVKSEIVLDRKQELRGSLRVYQQSPNLEGEESSLNDGCSVPFPLVKSSHLIPPPPAFRKSTYSLQLQNKLRKLLNADSKENLVEANSSVVTDGSRIKTNYECNDGFDSTKFSNKQCTASVTDVAKDSVNNYNCHKSLPDLTNVRLISLESYDGLEERRCNCRPTSACSNGFCTNSATQFTSFNLTPYQNEHCSSSANCDECRNWKSLDNEPDKVCTHGNSFPTSRVKSSISYVTPQLLYCDTKSVSDVDSCSLSSLQSLDIPPDDSNSLNTFFDQLGLQPDKYDSLTTPQSKASSPVYFSSSTNSVASVGGRGSGDESLSTNPIVDSPSIVERNARIIKWLYNCRKVMKQVPRPLSRYPNGNFNVQYNLRTYRIFSH